MPASTILSAVRTPLAAALSGVTANVFSYVPEQIPAPAVVNRYPAAFRKLNVA